MDARVRALHCKPAATRRAIHLSFRIDPCVGPAAQTTSASREAEVELVNEGGAASQAGGVDRVMAGGFAEYIPVMTNQASLRTSSAGSARHTYAPDGTKSE
jgi:hypothetical protein